MKLVDQVKYYKELSEKREEASALKFAVIIYLDYVQSDKYSEDNKVNTSDIILRINEFKNDIVKTTDTEPKEMKAKAKEKTIDEMTTREIAGALKREFGIVISCTMKNFGIQNAWIIEFSDNSNLHVDNFSFDEKFDSVSDCRTEVNQMAREEKLVSEREKRGQVSNA